MPRPFDPADAAEMLGDLSAEIGVTFVLGHRPHGSKVLGEPPMDAELYVGPDGAHGVAIESIASVHDVEAVLHEMAHALIGTEGDRIEWRCYEREAVWALRFGPEVAKVVARLAWETGGPHA
jgi:hypothetical protein